MSELSPIGTIYPSVPCPLEELSSIGHLVPNTEAILIDEEDNIVSTGMGELCIRGPQVMKGYHNAPDKTNESMRPDGFFKTGDVVRVDEKELFYIVDRKKELIKYKGHQVPPAYLEEVLLSHPSIIDAAVVGVKDENAGELPLGFVVIQKGATVTKEEILQYVDSKVSSYYRLRGGVRFIDQIPKSASGKILRRILRDEVAITRE